MCDGNCNGDCHKNGGCLKPREECSDTGDGCRCMDCGGNCHSQKEEPLKEARER